MVENDGIPEFLELLSIEGLRLRWIEVEDRWAVRFRRETDLPTVLRIGAALQRLTGELTNRRRELIALGAIDVEAAPEQPRKRKVREKPLWQRQTTSTVEHRSRIAD